MSGKIKKIIAAFASVVLAITPALGCKTFKKNGPSPDLGPHLLATPDPSPVRPINSAEEEALSPYVGPLGDTAYRERVRELYNIVAHDGKRPVFAVNDPVKPIYDEAINILNKYILNEWHGSDDGKIKIVHTIHDYIAANTTYDFDLYEDYIKNNRVSASASFDIDGVLINKTAVCDGISKTCDFLCAIEGIECDHVTGSYAGGPHAWNQVRVGGNWYNVDITADCVYYSDGTSNKKQLSHGFFMLDNNTIRTFSIKASNGAPQTHDFYGAFQTTYDDYNYYAPRIAGLDTNPKMITIGDKTFSASIKNQAELNNLFAAISDMNGAVGKVEVQLSFDGVTNVNNVDMYAENIKEAYGKLKSPDYAISAEQKPYFQFPNGVYMFLMYV